MVRECRIGRYILSTWYIGGTPFDGSGNINIANVTIEPVTTNYDYQIPFLQNVDSNTFLNRDSTGDTHITYNPSTNTLTCKKFVGDGSDLTGVTASAVTGEATTQLHYYKPLLQSHQLLPDTKIKQNFNVY